MIEELKEHKSLVIALVTVLLIAAAGIMFIAQNRGSAMNGSNTADKEGIKEPANSKIVAKGRLSAQPATGRFIYEVEEQVVVAIKGDSDGRDAVGFDAALKINQKVLDFSQAVSKLPSFEVFSNVNEERLYIGGIRKLDSKSASIFNNAELAHITFRAVAQGSSAVDFMFKPDETTESNIVLTSSQDGLGDVQGTTLYVGDKIDLSTATALIVPNTNVKLVLTSITPESAVIEMTLGTSKQPKTFTWGTGTVSENIEKFSGFVFQVQKGTANSVVVYYASDTVN
ncbi:MAG: hypothetical protein UZ22_OP11002000384 [Microgenomates bacterium OLB23]|nr:MAG: hypothetical protein UZ22_OP11002000384 [Microgenomates bacterium OLB23]